jgi:predicted O-methyltransferase YrrM
VDASPDRDVMDEIRRMTAAEDDVLTSARARAQQATDVPAPEVGALMAWAAATTAARTIVEIGAAGGVSGLWLLRGMEERSVLTSVEHDPHHHALATSAYQEAGVGERVRSILGEPTTVLPRLSDDGYQLCIIQGRPAEYPTYLEHALRLLRPGGMLIARKVMTGGDAALELATFAQMLAEDDRLSVSVLPVDGGIALATVR